MVEMEARSGIPIWRRWYVVEIWFAEDNDVIQFETGSRPTVAPPRLPSRKSAAQFYFRYRIG